MFYIFRYLDTFKGKSQALPITTPHGSRSGSGTQCLIIMFMMPGRFIKLNFS